MATLEVTTAKERAFPTAIEDAVRSALRTAGWEPEEGAGGTIWRNPLDRHWYDELRALAIQKAGVDPGSSS